MFHRPADGWTNVTQAAKLTASDGAEFDSLGVSVAIAGDTVVAGAESDDVGANDEQGSAYVFVRPAGGWANATQAARLTASDGAEFDFLGDSVAVAGDTVVAGGGSDDVGGNFRQGSAYVFVKPPGGWADATQTAKLTASDGAAGDRLGVSVAVAGDTVVAGASGYDVRANDDQGAVYVSATGTAPPAATSLAVRVRPRRDRRSPYVFRVSGRLRAPGECPVGGRMSVQVRARGGTVAYRPTRPRAAGLPGRSPSATARAGW